MCVCVSGGGGGELCIYFIITDRSYFMREKDNTRVRVAEVKKTKLIFHKIQIFIHVC